MEYENLNLRPSSDDDDSLPFSVDVEKPHNGPKIAAAALLVLAVAATGYLIFRNRTPAPGAQSAPAPAAEAPAAVSSPLGAEAPAIDLPPLDQSDDAVRGLVRELSANPSIAAWLATNNLIRSFTVVVNNIAAGQPAAKQAAALRPKGSFEVETRGEDLFINPKSYARYLPLATAASSIPPEDLARLYTTLKPRIQEAYAELGQPDTTFDQTLERALVRLLKTPIPQGRIAVEPSRAVVYRFADPALEMLSPAQKVLIRMGPDNQRTVQTSLRNIALALGIPEQRLP